MRGRTVISRADTNGEVDYNTNTSESLYGALDIDLSDATVMSFGLIHQTKDILPHNGYPAAIDGSLEDFSRSTYLGADWGDFDSRSTDVVAELTHRFDNGGYGRVAVRGSRRATDYLYAFSARNVNSGATSLAYTARDLEQDTLAVDANYSQPFELLGQVSEFVIGSDFKRYETETAEARGNLGGIDVASYRPGDISKPNITFGTPTETEEREAGLYAKLTFRPIERLALIGGARVSSFEGENSSATQDVRESGYVTPYGGLVFDLDDQHSLYASYSQVFKPQSEAGADGRIIDPREGEQYEVGIKGSYYGGDLNARITAFQLTDENRAAGAIDDSGAPISGVYEATGKTRIRGGELEISGYLTPDWEVLAGYTYMKTENLAGDDNALFALMPQHQASLWTKYTLPGGTLRGLGIGGGVTAMSDFHIERAGSPRLSAPGYAVVDAKLSYPITDKLTGTFDVNNLLDRKYYSRVGSVGTFNFYGPSRSFMLGARYEF